MQSCYLHTNLHTDDGKTALTVRQLTNQLLQLDIDIN